MTLKLKANVTFPARVVAGAGIEIERANGIYTISADPGPGDVVGPAIASDLAVARFDLTTGRLLQNSLFIVDDTGHVSSFGGNIKFPGTQVPSANANTLDDYEEGSATIGLTFGGASTGITYTNQLLHYVKIGQMVQFRLDLNLSSKGSAVGAAAITGLPFTSHGTVVASGFSMFVANMASQTGWTGLIDVSSSALLIYYVSAGTHAQAANTDFANNSRLLIGGCYQAAA
jgi:hypothetical protein